MIAAGSTLAQVRDAINAAGAGVTASLVADGSGQRLMLRSTDSGAAQAFSVAVDDADGASQDAIGLSALAFDPAAAAGSGRNLSLTQSAQDALVTVNGLQVSSPSNRLTGVIENVTLELGRATTSPVEVTVGRQRVAAWLARRVRQVVERPEQAACRPGPTTIPTRRRRARCRATRPWCASSSSCARSCAAPSAPARRTVSARSASRCNATAPWRRTPRDSTPRWRTRRRCRRSSPAPEPPPPTTGWPGGWSRGSMRCSRPTAS